MLELYGNNKEVVLAQLEAQVQATVRLHTANAADAFLEAERFAPALVQRETPVIDFLRTENYHPLLAAKRLASYWSVRKEFFGDRWLLPLTQTGGGALTSDQCEVLRTGAMVFTSGPYPVVICDYSRLPMASMKVDPAVNFYLCAAGVTEAAQTEGLCFLDVVSAELALPIQKLGQEIVQKLVNSLPIKVKSVVVARKFDPEQTDLLEYLARSEQQRVSGTMKTAVDCISCNSFRDTINSLEERGLDRSCVPLSLGGDYFYHLQFSEWIRARISSEEPMSSAPPIRNSSTANAVASKMATKPSLALVADTNSGSEDEEEVEDDLSPMPGESRAEFEKRRRRVYSKRNYNKKRKTQDVLKEKCHCLKKQNSSLRAENRKLIALEEQARLLVSVHVDAIHQVSQGQRN